MLRVSSSELGGLLVVNDCVGLTSCVEEASCVE